MKRGLLAVKTSEDSTTLPSMRYDGYKTSESLLLYKTKSVLLNGLTDNPMLCNYKQNCFGAHSLADSVGYGDCVTNTPLVYLFIKRHLQLLLNYAWQHHAWTTDHCERFTWSNESLFILQHVDGRVRVCRFPGELLRPLMQQVIHRTVVWWRCSNLDSILVGVSGTYNYDRIDNEDRELSEHHCEPVSSFNVIYLPK